MTNPSNRDRARRRMLPSYTAGLLVFLLGACAQAPMKPSAGHVRPEPAPASGAITAPVQISTMVPKPKLVPRPETYSVVVNNVKVQELLFALARDAKLNIDVHPGIAGVVTLNAIDQTLQQLLARLSRQVDMRWELDGPNLIVTPDSPYLRVYKIDYVNMERQTQGQVGVATQISTPGGGGVGGGGGGNTSTTSVRNQSNNKFWETLVENIKDMLRETDKVLPGGPGATQAAGQPTPPPGAIATLAQAAAGGQPGATPTPTVSF